jgi:transposase
MGRISMDAKESKIYRLACKVLAGNLSIKDFSKLSGKSYRQSQRIIKRVNQEDLFGVFHKNRGKGPHNKTSDQLEETIIDLLRYRYEGFNLAHFREKLIEVEHIQISKSSLHRIASKHGLVKAPRRYKRRSHKLRARMPQEGMLIQFDGSNHVWFGEHRTDLIVGIDDATGSIKAAEFFYGETSMNSLKVIKTLVDNNGLPDAFYMDQAGIYGKLDREWESQIARAFEQTGIRLILASSPQAKGRVERLFRTLQDRLVSELKFYSISGIEEANEYLKKFIPMFNERFSVKALETEKAYRKNIFGKTEMIFCRKERRKVCPGNLFSWNSVQWIIQEKRCYRGREVNINTHIDGSYSFDMMGKKIEAKVFKANPSYARNKRAV